MYFDIGANVGSWSTQNIHSTTKIIAVEASNSTFNQLKHTCANTSIVPLNYAVCNNNGNDVVFYEAQCSVLSTLNKDWLTSTDSRFHNQPYTSVVCKSITIDNLIKEYGVPDLIKVDVEGGEYDCVSSLTTKVDQLCFEWASEVNHITFKCLDYLFSLGFTKFYLQMGDEYTFRPSEYYDVNTVKTKLNNTVPKVDWGMLWCA
jgi:FkbM family methyltransferase